jgi:holo-[acyl-carrier protein] synthase
MGTGSTVRVGADLMGVSQVANSVVRFGDRYLRRVYTDHEIASCVGLPTVVAAGLAARFAAKEATIKVLQPPGYQPDWRTMEVRRHSEGWCTMALSGHAASLAEEAGIYDLAVSLSHEESVAFAVVVALCRELVTSTGEPGTRLCDGPSKETR